MSDLDLNIIHAALDSHLRALMDNGNQYIKGNNPEGHKAVMEEWHRVHKQLEKVIALKRAAAKMKPSQS